MFGSAILEAAIGTVLVYLLLSLFCSVLNEWISRLQGLRSAILSAELRRLLGSNLAGAFNAHPLIRGMFDRGQYPHYIPSSTFALTIIQIGFNYTPGVGGHPGATSVQPRWTGRDQRLLEGLREFATSVSPLQARIEKWFDLAMEQASGNFKRRAQLYILIISAFIVGGANIDSISIAAHLYSGALSRTPTYFAIGWPDNHTTISLKLCGLLLTWAAVSIGAPFWFDMLNKLVNLRQTGLPPDENDREKESAAFRMVAQ